MQIEIDDNSGFCYGVVKTIKLAEDILTEGKPVYCLGEIVHNQAEVERLKAKGLTIIGHEDLKNIKGANVLIRAHGEPPSTYNQVGANQNTLIEGSCPIVLSLQQKIKKHWGEIKDQQGQVVIYGKKGHAEVIGLAGQTNGEAIIIEKIDDLAQIDYSKPIALFAQTTQPAEGYAAIEQNIRQRMEAHFADANIPLRVANSICGHVSKRGTHLAKFAHEHDVVIFVSGSNSSNGKVLLEVCKKNNPRTNWVSSPDEINPEWFKEARSVGICGATSTPRWLMEDVSKKIKELT